MVNIKLGTQFHKKDFYNSGKANFLISDDEIERLRKTQDNSKPIKIVQIQGRLVKEIYEDRCSKQNNTNDYKDLPTFFNFTVLVKFCNSSVFGVCDLSADTPLYLNVLNAEAKENVGFFSISYPIHICFSVLL